MVVSSPSGRFYCWLINIVIILGSGCSYAGEDEYRVLEKYYLKQFSQFESEAAGEGFMDDNKASQPRVLTQLSPYRLRQLMIHFLFPECNSEKSSGKDPQRLKSQTDIWGDLNVFSIPQKVHLYDSLFPGATRLGEVAGACRLAMIGWSSEERLRKNQKMIERLQYWYDSYSLQLFLKDLDRRAADFIALLDDRHPFYSYLTANFFIPEWGAPLGSHSKQIQSFSTNVPRNVNISMPVLMNLYGAQFSNRAEAARASIVLLFTKLALNSHLTRGVSANNVGMAAGYYFGVIYLSFTIANAARNLRSHKKVSKRMVGILDKQVRALLPFYKQIRYLNSSWNVSIYQLFAVPITEDELAVLEHILAAGTNLDIPDENLDFSYHEKLLGILRSMLLLRDYVIKVLRRAADIDFFLSVAKQLNETDTYCSVSWVSPTKASHAPLLKAKGMVHPLLDPDMAVPSSISLGGNKTRNRIITGDHGSGKSTLLRSLGINTVFLAQNLGIATSGSFEIRPFTHFNSMINKVDHLGAGSFDSETRIIKKLLIEATRRKNTERELIISDELLRSTNPAEASIGSFNLAKHFGKQPGTVTIVTTHLNALAALPEEYPELFSNHHMGKAPEREHRLLDGPDLDSDPRALLKEMLGVDFQALADQL